jgi:hypothetical protein
MHRIYLQEGVVDAKFLKAMKFAVFGLGNRQYEVRELTKLVGA